LPPELGRATIRVSISKHILTMQARHSLAWGLMALAPLFTSTALAAASALPVSSYTLSQDGANNGWYNDSGGELTDGLVGGPVGPGYSYWAPYVLWDGHSPTITFDLGQNTQVGSLRAHFLTYPRAAVYLPLSATVSYSLDGIHFGPAQTVATGYDSTVSLANDQVVSLDFITPGQGRFVALSLETPGRWFALSEVQLMSPVPEVQAGWLAVAGGALALAVGRRRKTP
jgi:hypothetical protein